MQNDNFPSDEARKIAAVYLYLAGRYDWDPQDMAAIPRNVLLAMADITEDVPVIPRSVSLAMADMAAPTRVEVTETAPDPDLVL